MSKDSLYKIEWRQASPYDSAYAVLRNGHAVAWTLTKWGARAELRRLQKTDQARKA